MNEKLQELIKEFEDRLKMLTADQRTDDAMDRRKFEGVSQTYEEVISKLKELVK